MICQNCKNDVNAVVIHCSALWCWACHDATKDKLNPAPYVIGDECDVYIKHGICNSDGTPKRYRSKSEIRQAAFDTGYSQGGDTPKVNQRFVDGAGMRELAKHK